MKSYLGSSYYDTRYRNLGVDEELRGECLDRERGSANSGRGISPAGRWAGSRAAVAATPSTVAPFRPQPTTVGADVLVASFCFSPPLDVPSTLTSAVVMGGDQEGTRSEPEVGAAAANYLGDGEAELMDDDTREGDGDGGGGQEFQQQEMEPALQGMEGPQAAANPRRYRTVFTAVQLQELENLFRHCQYPDIFAR